MLTSNRDESPKRSPENITTLHQNGIELVFPRDTGAGGTWIAIANTNRVVCLLNGAFDKHKHQPPYQKSRGIMVLDFFNYTDANDFFDQYRFEGMEPFTMIVLENGQLIEARWDEKKLHLMTLDTQQPHIWSSSTLYTDTVKKKRKQWFANWLEIEKKITPSSILDFHKTGGEGDPTIDLIMNRSDIVQTVSITSINKQDQHIDLEYHDLIRSQIKYQAINLQSEVLESYQK